MGLLQNIEVLSTYDQQYLSIHKNGSSTIRKELNNRYGDSKVEEEILKKGKGPRWTCLRDPYARFIDALSYDLKLVGIPVTEAGIRSVVGSEYQLNSYIIGTSNPRRGKGFVRHSMLQTSYVLDNLDFFVLDKDLSIFCNIHFSTPLDKPGENMGSAADRQEVSKYLEHNPSLKSYLNGILAIDYHLLNRLKAKELQWNWTDGRIF